MIISARWKWWQVNEENEENDDKWTKNNQSLFYSRLLAEVALFLAPSSTIVIISLAVASCSWAASTSALPLMVATWAFASAQMVAAWASALARMVAI